MTRSASRSRTTKETDISITVEVDGDGTNDISTGLPFFDHMLDQLGRHGGMNLTLHATGDLHVDGHHTVEDVGILLGETFREALGDKAGVRRFASGLFPLDEAMANAAILAQNPAPVTGGQGAYLWAGILAQRGTGFGK